MPTLRQIYNRKPRAAPEYRGAEVQRLGVDSPKARQISPKALHVSMDQRVVLLRWKHSQIFNPVVAFPKVDVVDLFTGTQVPPKCPLDN